MWCCDGWSFGSGDCKPLVERHAKRFVGDSECAPNASLAGDDVDNSLYIRRVLRNILRVVKKRQNLLHRRADGDGFVDLGHGARLHQGSGRREHPSSRWLLTTGRASEPRTYRRRGAYPHAFREPIGFLMTKRWPTTRRPTSQASNRPPTTSCCRQPSRAGMRFVPVATVQPSLEFWTGCLTVLCFALPPSSLGEVTRSEERCV